MRMPPSHLLRDGPPPGDSVLVVRGGYRSLRDEHLERQTADCWEKFGFFGISVFADARKTASDLGALSRQVDVIARRPMVQWSTCGALRDGGFAVVATFARRHHFSLVLPGVTVDVFERLRFCLSEPVPNPAFRPR